MIEGVDMMGVGVIPDFGPDTEAATDYAIYAMQHLMTTCTICGRPAVTSGMFFPDNSQFYGAREGKTRRFVFGVCSTCYTPGDLDRMCDRVMEAIRRKLVCVVIKSRPVEFIQ